MDLYKRVERLGGRFNKLEIGMCIYKINDVCPEERCDGYGNIKAKAKKIKTSFYHVRKCCSYCVFENIN